MESEHKFRILQEQKGLLPSLYQQRMNDLEQQLAAAKAELAAEREKRESLEKQNKELFPYYQDHLEGALIPATEYQKWIKRAEQAEAQCKRMEGALQEIAKLHDKEHYTLFGELIACRIAIAALEEKP